MKVDTGKYGKRTGATCPRDARHIDGTKPTVGLGGTIALKNFGYSYQYRFFSKHSWRVRVSWFKTERARDQSLEIFREKYMNSIYYQKLSLIQK